MDFTARLKEAERNASQRIQHAKDARSQLMKQAADDAAADIEKYDVTMSTKSKEELETRKAESAKQQETMMAESQSRCAALESEARTTMADTAKFVCDEVLAI